MHEGLHARVDGADLGRLERQLAIDMSSIEPGTFLSGDEHAVRAPARRTEPDDFDRLHNSIPAAASRRRRSRHRRRQIQELWPRGDELLVNECKT